MEFELKTKYYDICQKEGHKCTKENTKITKQWRVKIDQEDQKNEFVIKTTIILVEQANTSWKQV